mgnify:CR=1 FL=1
MEGKMGKHHPIIERLKLEIEQRKVGFAGEFLTDHFNGRKIYELEEETEKLRRDFPIWKSQKEGLLYLDRVGIAIVCELTFRDLVDTASLISNNWAEEARKVNSQDESLLEVRNFRLWEYFHAITVEAVEQEEREKGKKYDRTKLLAYLRSESEDSRDGIDTAESVDQFLRRRK